LTASFAAGECSSCGYRQKCRHILFFILQRSKNDITNHFGWDFAGEMVVTNTIFVLKKFLQCFFPKNFLRMKKLCGDIFFWLLSISSNEIEVYSYL